MWPTFLALHSTLLLHAVIAASADVQNVTENPRHEYISKKVLDQRDTSLTWSLSIVNGTVVKTRIFPDCYVSCVYPCIAFTYNYKTRECTTGDCSQVQIRKNSSWHFVRALDGLMAKDAGNANIMDRLLDITTSCVALDIYGNRSGEATVLIRELHTSRGYHFYLPNTAVKNLGLRSSGTPLTGQMVRSDKLSPRSPQEVRCSSKECIRYLCQSDYDLTTGYKLFLSTSENCEVLGLVASEKCCGAGLRVAEYKNGIGRRYYGGASEATPDGFKETGMEFYLWRKELYTEN